MTQPLVCTIDRQTWARGKHVPDEEGEDGEKNHLLNDDNTRCCLGFLGQCVGVSDENMLQAALPDNLSPDDLCKYPSVSARVWSDFTRINDDRYLTEEDREKSIQALAKANGFEFRFV